MRQKTVRIFIHQKPIGDPTRDCFRSFWTRYFRSEQCATSKLEGKRKIFRSRFSLTARIPCGNIVVVLSINKSSKQVSRPAGCALVWHINLCEIINFSFFFFRRYPWHATRRINSNLLISRHTRTACTISLRRFTTMLMLKKGVKRNLLLLVLFLCSYFFVSYLLEGRENGDTKMKM